MSAERNCTNNITYNDLQNPLFIHPLDGPASWAVEKKLVGAKLQDTEEVNGDRIINKEKTGIRSRYYTQMILPK